MFVVFAAPDIETLRMSDPTSDILNYMDRSNLSYAKWDISQSLSLSDAQYGFAASIFQLGYLAFEGAFSFYAKCVQKS